MIHPIFKSDGRHLGFVMNDGNVFSRDGIYLGWIEGIYAWDRDGQFRGLLTTMKDHKYILKNRYSISPLSKVPRPVPPNTTVPTPLAIISPISLPIGFADGF